MRPYIALLAVILLIAAGCTIPSQGKPSSVTGNVDSTPLKPASTTDLIEQLKKSVVFVNYTGTQRGYDGSPEPFDAVGSGVIYSSDSNYIYVLTNRHVVDLSYEDEYAQSIGEAAFVRTYSNTTYEVVKRLFAPYNLDMAILVLPRGSEDLAPVHISESDPQSGDDVLVIGMPELLDWSVSKGIVSAVRNFTVEDKPDGQQFTAIQTDAAVNEGNSGGGMFTLDGRLVGINSWKYWGFGVEGLNFAISAQEFLKYKESFTETPFGTTGQQQVSGKPPVSIGSLYVTNNYYDADYGYQYDVLFTLKDADGLTTTSDGNATITIENGDGVLYKKTLQVKAADFMPQGDYPFFDRPAYSHAIDFNEINRSQTYDVNFTVGFSVNGTTFNETSEEYLPDVLVTNGPVSNGLKPIGTSVSQGDIRVNLTEGGQTDEGYTIKLGIANTGFSKKEVEIKDAVIVSDGQQYSADTYYSDEFALGDIYPAATVPVTLVFTDLQDVSGDTAFYLDLRIIDGNQLRTQEYKITFTPTS